MTNFKAILTITALMFSMLTASASSLDSIIQKTYLNKTSTIAISVKDTATGKVIYEYNQNKLLNPASVQKLFTLRSAYKELGKDYTFNTTAYTDYQNNLYIKLGADPTLTTERLVNLLKTIKEQYPEKIYNDIIIDPTIIDNKQWGIGWMWDDDPSKLLPKYSPYSINENKITIKITPSKTSIMPEINNQSSYPMQIINKIKQGNSNNLTFERMPWNTSDATTIIGTIKKEETVQLPVNLPEKHFTIELNNAIKKSKIKTNGTLKIAPVSENADLLSEIKSQTLEELVGFTLKNSNNFYTEMIFKVAGGHYKKNQGTTEDAVEMFEKEYSTLSDDGHIIVDGCGMSRNNLLTVDWVTSALNKIYKEEDFSTFEKLLAKPVEGTLANRLLNISLKVRAKTGTASGISSIAGYIDAKSGKKYSFAIIIQNHNINPYDVKNFEDKLINEIYKM